MGGCKVSTARPAAQLRRGLSLVVAGVLTGALALTGAAVTPANATSIKDKLPSAPVPSLCEYPAGRLVNGRLPGTGAGNVTLDLTRSRVGNLIKGGGSGAAAVLSCSQGGVGWPDHVVFYDSKLRIIGHFDSGRIGVQSGRAHITAVSISKRVVTIRVIAVGQSGDNDLWGSAGAKVTYAYDRHKKSMTRRAVKIYRELSAGKKLLSLVRAGKVSQAKKLADGSVVSGLKRLVAEDKRSKHKWITVGVCIGPFSEYVPSNVDLSYGDRGCYYTIHRRDAATGDDYASGFLAVFGHRTTDRNWTGWHANSWYGVSG